MMQRLQFSIDINADKEKIWHALWSDQQYREWVGVFSKGSYVIADDWNVGSKVHFLGPDQSGIYSSIDIHKPNELISFKHIAGVLNGHEQPIDEESRKWTGAKETYSLIDSGAQITLRVDIDIMDEHVEFMSSKFPLALEKIKVSASKLTEE